jgi:tetracycline 7-halogenase / FADH2 O2-dependent halogenase
VSADFDLAIVGSGFGGSILSMIARRLGLRAVLLERGRHPRFAIGESASPLAGILIEQLADRYDLPRLRPLSAFGTWQRAYPDVACGLKRGFTYFKHEDGQRYRTRSDRSNQLLVAASPNDELSDTHWLRADVDHFLVREAAALGVEYVDDVQLDAIEWRANGVPRLHGVRHGQSVRFDARMVVDASGPRGLLSRALGIADRGFDAYPATQALFSHFTNVPRCQEMPDFDADWGRVPYPVDDAALHHVFDGGWMWVLRFGNGVTSAGIAVTDALAAELRVADGEPAWRRFLGRYPSSAAQFADATAIRGFTWMPRMAYRAAEAAGPGWAMLPSAAGFVDPLFSTGIPLTLLGIERLATLLRSLEGGPDRLRQGYRESAAASAKAEGPPLCTDNYASATLADVDHTAAFVGGCYAAFPRFAAFTSYSMFYFAAASYAEMARRIDGARRPSRFLCADRFGEETLRLSPSSEGDAVGEAAYHAAVAAAIEPLNIAGLCEPHKRNWYGVDLEDTVRGAAKLGVTAEAVRKCTRLIAEC